MSKITEAQRRYQNSEKGKLARKKYQSSEKGKASHVAYLAKRKAKLAELKQVKEVEPVNKEEEAIKIKEEVAEKK